MENETLKTSQQKYRQTDKGKNTQKKYSQSEKGKKTIARWQKSDKAKESRRKYYQKNKHRIRQYSFEHYNSEEGKAKKKDYNKRINSLPENKLKKKIHRLKKYKLSIDDYSNLLHQQNNCCAICNTPQDKLTKELAVDHNHNTNKVRGLLCYKCNSILGYANDDIKILEKAIQYLISNKCI